MRRIDSLVPFAIEKELVRAAHANQVLRRWDEVVGPMLSQRSWPDRYDEKGIVWVAVQGSAWAQELRFMKEIILSRMSAMCSEPNAFKDVRFGVRSLPKRPTDEPVQGQLVPEQANELTIREIAERRLKKWKDEGAT